MSSVFIDVDCHHCTVSALLSQGFTLSWDLAESWLR